MMDYIINIAAPFIAFLFLMLLSLAASSFWLALALNAALFSFCLYRPDLPALLPSVTVWAAVIIAYFTAHCFDKDVRILKGPEGRKTSWRKMLISEYGSFRAWSKSKFGLTKTGAL